MTAAGVYTLYCTVAGFLHSAIGNWKLEQLEQLEFEVGRFLHPSWLPIPQHPHASRLIGVHKQQFHSTKQGTCTLFFVTASRMRHTGFEQPCSPTVDNGICRRSGTLPPTPLSFHD